MADSAMDPNGSASFTPSGPANSEHLWRLTRNLLDLQKSGKFCDLQLLCQDGSLTAHSVVLASACDTLQATIQHQHMHLPMMDYSLETVQRMVTYLYTGHIDPPPPHEEISFQNLMDSMGLPHTQPDDIGDFMSSSVYPVTSPTRIDQDIKPHLVAGQAIPSGSRSKKMPKHLAPVVSLVQLNLDTFEDDDEDDDDDYGDNDGQEGEMGEIDIKQEIVSDDDEPSTPPEAHTPNFDGFRSSNRGRKRKVTYDEDYDYDDHQDDYEEDYSPQIPKVSQKRKSTPKRAMPAKARKSMKSSNNTIVRKTEVEDPNSSEQFDESQSFAEGDSSLMEGMEDQKPQIPKPKKKEYTRTINCKYCNQLTDDIVEHMAVMHSDIRRKWRVRICPICGYRSHQKVGFVYHMNVEHNDTSHGVAKIHRCEMCDFQSPYQCIFKQHKKRVHEKVKEYVCRICGAAYADKRNLDAHKVHHEETRAEGKPRKFPVCPICGYIGYHKSQFVLHMMKKHNDTSYGPVQSQKCDQCDYESEYPVNLRNHIKTVHENGQNYMCDICGYTVTTQASLTSHKKTHEPGGGQSFNLEDGDQSMIDETKPPGERPKKSPKKTPKAERTKTVCEICGQEVLDVKAHVLRKHSDQKPVSKIYICPTCGWTTKDTSYFKFHMINKHQDYSHGTVKVFKCEFCEYENYSRHIIWKHTQRVHKKIKDFQCEICGHSVTTKSALLGHRLSHSEEGRTSLQCPHCSYATCWPNVLSRHIDRKHTQSTVRWPCTLCNGLLKEKDVLKLHLRKKHGLSIEEANERLKTAVTVNSYDTSMA